MEFLSGNTATKYVREVNYEYPVKADVKPSNEASRFLGWIQSRYYFSRPNYLGHHEAAIKLLNRS